MAIGMHMTVKNPLPSSGRAHIVEVHCDLCKKITEIDSTKVKFPLIEADKIAETHVCQKPDKAAKKAEEMRAKAMVPTAPVVEQYETGSRGERLRRDEKEK